MLSKWCKIKSQIMTIIIKGLFNELKQTEKQLQLNNRETSEPIKKRAGDFSRPPLGWYMPCKEHAHDMPS